MTAKTLSDYLPIKTRQSHPLSLLLKVQDIVVYDKHQLAMNTDSTKEAHTDKSVKPIDINSDDNVSIDSITPLLDKS